MAVVVDANVHESELGDVLPKYPLAFTGEDGKGPACERHVLEGLKERAPPIRELQLEGPEIHRRKVQTGGKVRSSPIIAGGTVFVGSDSGKLFALDLATGKGRF